eukprot:7535537-Heterocapsa_arctica.AAC.1
MQTGHVDHASGPPQEQQRRVVGAQLSLQVMDNERLCPCVLADLRNGEVALGSHGGDRRRRG